RQVDVPTAVYAQPADRFVAGLLGWPPSNLTDGVLVCSIEPGGGLRFAAADGSFHLPMPAELVTHGAEGQPVTVGIRPEDVELTTSAPPLTSGNTVTLSGWSVERAEFIPPRWLITVGLGRSTWRVWHAKAVATSANVDLVIVRQQMHWFDGQNGLRLK